MTEGMAEGIWPGGVGGAGGLPLSYEWLVTNGVGGYAAGTVAGAPSRRYHGMLIASLANPLGRVVMLSDLREELSVDDTPPLRLGAWDPLERGSRDSGVSRQFRLEMGLPIWRYRVGDAELERRVIMPHGRNTVQVSYRLAGSDLAAQLRIRPLLGWREQEKPVSYEQDLRYTLTWCNARLEITSSAAYPPLRFSISAARSQFIIDPLALEQVLYPVEEERGYSSSGPLWSPGYYAVDLPPGGAVTFVASTEDWPVLLALTPGEASLANREYRKSLLARAVPFCRSGPGAQLVLAANDFVVSPGYRLHEVERALAAGKELRTILAGYYWFTDWGRDTMISLEGLTLCTGRFDAARQILLTFASYVKKGLVPNMFPAGSNEGIYNTADATLWFLHALARYVQITGDSRMLRELLPTLTDIVDHHLEGTSFGIGADPGDGLLRQGVEGMPLTWMDAVFEGNVVTPRRGKAVEINALWYNGLRLMELWTRQEGGAGGQRYAELAGQVQESFNRRFWHAEGGYLFDVVDTEHGGGNDARFRPNQIFAVSLPYPVLHAEHWQPVVEAVRQRLLTPYGLRSLAPDDPDYHHTYHGNRASRDSAYHQGTVWAWLIGPFIDAWLRVHPDDRRTAAAFLAGLIGHLDEFGVGSIAEVFDAEPPYHPHGCTAQAWSVAEVIRLLALLDAPGPA